MGTCSGLCLGIARRVVAASTTAAMIPNTAAASDIYKFIFFGWWCICCWHLFWVVLPDKNGVWSADGGSGCSTLRAATTRRARAAMYKAEVLLPVPIAILSREKKALG